MKHLKKFIFSLIVSLLTTTNCMAKSTTIDGISYDLDQNNRTASVTGSKLEKVVVPETIVNNDITYVVTSIAANAFWEKTTIKSIKTGNTIKEIKTTNTTDGEKGPFYKATNLEEADFGDNLEVIGAGAFWKATNLKKIQVGKKLTKIGKIAFKECISLEYIVLPMSISSVITVGTSSYEAYRAANDSFYNTPQLTIICLNQGFDTGYPSQTMYPSSFLTFSSNTSVYNGKVPEIDYTFNGIGFGFKPTKVEIDNSTTDLSFAGEHTSVAHCTFTNENMSFDVDIPCSYTITPATLKATVNNVSRLYGEKNPDFSTTYTGFVNGEDKSVITSNGTYSTTAKQNSDIGTYTITQSNAIAQNYIFEYQDGTLTVNKAPLTVIANDKEMVYGGTVPALDVKYQGLKNNEISPVWSIAPQLSTSATSISHVGEYPIIINSAEAKNYDVNIVNGKLTVKKASLMVKADNKIRKYGELNPEFTLTYSGLVNGETTPQWVTTPIVETTATQLSGTGTYPITIANATAKDYEITTNNGTLTVEKATLDIKPKNAIRIYGEDNPTFELLYDGLKNNETQPEWTTLPVISTTATKKSDVGKYNIEIYAAEAKNYTIEKTPGTLEITKAPLLVQINNCVKKYGKANPTFSLSYSGLVNNETIPVWSELPAISSEASEKSEVGQYTITATGGTLKNYSFDYITSGKLTIEPASLVIKASDSNRLYCENNPVFQYTCSGFVNGESETVLTKKPSLQTNATWNSNTGTYSIEIGGAESKNYSITYEKGIFDVQKRELTVTTKNVTRAYGENNPDFELIYDGFVNNEDENVLLMKPKASTVATPSSNVGIYSIEIANGVAENYYFNCKAGQLTIEKAYQTLSWNQDISEVKQYDQIELTAMASSGLEVTYSIEGNSTACSITQIGNRQYLDCNGEGDVIIIAQQKGNDNYWQTTKIYKPLTIVSSTGIESLRITNSSEMRVYDINGKEKNTLQQGVNLVRISNGTVKKLILK